MRSPRLHVETPLAAGAQLALGPERAHYLGRVLRLRPGAEVRVFNARDGEWTARILAVDRRATRLRVEGRLRPPATSCGPTLYVAPPKRIRFEWLVEKATELGAGRIVPIETRYGVARPGRSERLRAIAAEAAEQCGRMDVPEVTATLSWSGLLAETEQMPLLMADETGGMPVLRAASRSPGAALLVGPEGGFAAEEREFLRRRPGVLRVGLGPRILRTETAALVLLACHQASLEAAAEGS